MGRVTRTWLAVAAPVLLAMLLIAHEQLAAAMIDGGVAGALFSAGGFEQPDALATAGSFLVLRAALFLLVPGAIGLGAFLGATRIARGIVAGRWNDR